MRESKAGCLGHADSDKSQQEDEYGAADGQHDRHHGDDVFDGIMFMVFRGLGRSAGHTEAFKSRAAEAGCETGF